jgi:hypothetical protein
MNYNEWRETEPTIKFGDQIHCGRLSWEACKKEVLKILNRPNKGNINDLPEDRTKEIEKL